MPTLLFKNNASTTLSGSINNTQTTITVASSSGFPTITGSDYFYATMYEVSGSPATEINIEIVKVTGVVGSNWTIVRGQDESTARSRNGVATCYVELRWTAASGALMVQKDNNLSDLTNAATARTNLGLGTMATQSAASVAITGGTISGVTLTSLDSTTTIQDNADPTKQFRFEGSGITAGATRVLTVPDADGTIATTAAVAAAYQPLDADLTAVAGLSTTGVIARTGAGTAATRTLTAPAAGFTITNGNGVAGNPTFVLANDLAAAEAINTTGFVRRTATDTWSASAIVDGDLPVALTGKTYNALTLTANATGFSVAGGTTSKTLTVQNSITLAGTDATTITLPATTGTVALNNQTFFLGTTSIAINRTSASISLTGVNIDGSAGSATSATSATTATNLASGVLGSLPYQSAAATTTLLPPNTSATRNFLRMTGTGSAGAAPAWDTVTKTDVGLANVENTALSTWAGSTNITTLGTVTSGTWNATAIAIARGGTGATTAVAAFDALSPATTLGDLIYSDGTDNVRLPGNTVAGRRFLRQTGTGTVSAAPAWDALVDGDIPSALTGKTYNALTLTAAATGFTVAGGTTSKTLTVSNTLTLAGTDSSTLNIGAGGTLGSAAFTASTAYAPAAGSSSIATVGTITSGTWQGSAIGISNGGTGATSKAAGYNALTPITTLGDLVYGDGANSATRLAGNTVAAKRFLTQTGTGSVSAAPGWNAIVDGDIPSALTGKTYNGLTLTANATGFQVAGGTTAKTLVVQNNITLAGTDGSTLNIGGGGTLGSAAYTASTAYQPVDADLTAIAALTGTSGFLRTNGAGTWSVDTATYLTGNQSITLSGDATGSGATAITVSIGAATVTGKALTGYASGSNAALAATDTILGAFGKVQGQLDAKSPLASPTFTGTPAAPTAAADTNTTQIATTAFVAGQASSTNPAMNGTVAVGTSLRYARADHVHASDTSRAPLASPTFTGTPAAPTAAVDTNTTQIATTAYVVGQGYLKSATASSTYLPLAGGSLAGNLTFSGTARRIIADFDNGTLANRLAFQTSTTNGTTAVQAIANGTGAASYYVAFAGSDPANAAYGWLSATTTGVDIYSDKTGTGSVQPIRLLTGGTVRATVTAAGRLQVDAAQDANITAVGALDINCSLGNYFTKTINGASTFTVSNVPSGRAYAFTLELTHTSGAVTWFSGVQWPNQTAPTLTTGRTHLFTFVTDDGGTRWRGASQVNYTN